MGLRGRFGTNAMAAVLMAILLATAAPALAAAPPPAGEADLSAVQALVRGRHFDRALAMTEAILTDHPRDDEVRLQRARLLFWRGRNDEAVTEATAVWERNHFDTGAILLLAQVQLVRRDFDQAVRWYREAQLRGEADPMIVQRLVWLYLQLGDPAAARRQIRPGVTIPEELDAMLAKAERPWLVEGLYGITLWGTQIWHRGQASAVYQFNPSLALLGGLVAEDRTLSTAYGLLSELYFQRAPFGGTVHLGVHPVTGDFLPVFDAWLDVRAFITDHFLLGAWLRYAQYTQGVISVGPQATIIAGRLSLTPGLLFVFQTTGQMGYTAFAKARWQHSVRQAWFMWAYLGQDGAFSARALTSLDESLFSLVVGTDQWFSNRWGIRVLATMIQPLSTGVTAWDLVVSLRGRL